MGDVDAAAVKFATDSSALAVGFLRALYRAAAALNMSEAIKHLDDISAFTDIRARQLEVQFRDVLTRQVLQAGALSTADLLGTRPCDPTASAWDQYVRSQGAPDLAAGVDAVVHVWGEKVTRYWDDSELKRASVKVHVPGDASRAAFAMMQCAVRDLVWKAPWIVTTTDPDDIHFLRAMANGLVESCVSVQGDLAKGARRNIFRQLARPMLPGYERSQTEVPAAVSESPGDDAEPVADVDTEQHDDDTEFVAEHDDDTESVAEVDTNQHDDDAESVADVDANQHDDDAESVADVDTDQHDDDAAASVADVDTEQHDDDDAESVTDVDTDQHDGDAESVANADPEPTEPVPVPPMTELMDQPPSIPEPMEQVPAPPMPEPMEQVPAPPMPEPMEQVPAPPMPEPMEPVPALPMPGPNEPVPAPPMPEPMEPVSAPPMPEPMEPVPAPPVPEPAASQDETFVDPDILEAVGSHMYQQPRDLNIAAYV